MPRKRTYAEVEASEPSPENKEISLVQRIRNMWEFASVMQYIFMFGKMVKIDEDFDIEDFENECLRPGHSDKLEEIGLQLLRFVSSNRGLNFDNWDEYVRRQYQSKAPSKPHPYGDAEETKKFRGFDIFTKIRVLHQLSVWTFWNPDRIRGGIPDAKESEQLDWRMNVFGWDEEDREYYVLDDNRLYRRTEPSLPAAPKAKPKANSVKARAARRRANKRRKLEEAEVDTETHDEDEDVTMLEPNGNTEDSDLAEIDTFGGFKWECVAITLDEYQSVIEKLKTSAKNYPNERAMRERLVEEVLPLIQDLAEKQRRKQKRRERELMMMERMAGAKRSSRLADKHDRERKEEEEAELAKKRAADLAAARKEQERQENMERERQSRMMTREQRIKDREYKRLLMEEELARDAEEQKRIEEGEKRGSERHIRERIERNKKELEELEQDEEWTFDCSGCGVHGKNIDDGSHSIACERCNVWQHSKCLGISKAAAEKDDFTFVCNDCRQKERQEAKRKEEEAKMKEEEANKPKIMLKFRSDQSSSPPQPPPQPIFAQGGSGSTKPFSITQGSHTQQPSPTPPVNGYNGYHRPQHTSSHPNQVSMAGQLPGQSHGNGLVQSQQQPHAATHSSTGSVQQHVQSDHNQMLSPAERHKELPGAPTTINGSIDSRQQQAQRNSSFEQKGDQTQSTGSFGSIQSTPKPNVVHGPLVQPDRLPSPILNRPRMSPTQGNPDVGPIAGIPDSSPRAHSAERFALQANGASHAQDNQPRQPLTSSPPAQRSSQTPQPQQLSGLSPIKQRSPLPLAANTAAVQRAKPESASHYQSSFDSFSSALGNNSNFNKTPVPIGQRSISGTPIFPPAEKLAPSPEHMDRGPVPTPSKQPNSSPSSSFDP